MAKTDDEHGNGENRPTAGFVAAEALVAEAEDGPEHDPLPPAMRAAIGDDEVAPEVELDATAWLLEADPTSQVDTTAAEVKTTWLELNVGHGGERKIIRWGIRPIDPDLFKKFRGQAGANRALRRATSPGQVAAEINETKYHLLIVTAATVSPDLRAAAAAKGVADPSLIVANRFRHKAGLITQISGYVSDISGFDEADVEVAAGNS